MKIHGFKEQGLAQHLAETICGIYIRREFTTSDKSEITCKRCIAKLKGHD